MKILKKFIILATCILVVLSTSACKIQINVGDTSDISSSPKSSISSQTDESESPATNSGTINDSGLVPQYEHYDPTEFENMCEELTSLSDDGDLMAITLYDPLKEQLEYISTLNSVSLIIYYEDVTNEDNQAEYEYTDELCTNCADLLYTSLHKLATGTLSDYFKDYLEDDDLFNEFVDYEPMTQEEKDLVKEETSLENEYQKIMDNYDSYSCEYKGHVYSLDEFYDADSDLANSGISSDDYYSIYEKCMEAFNEDAGDIYLQLVQIRTRLAKIKGYDNYSDYADTEIYYRDYSAEDLESLKYVCKDDSYSSYYSELISYIYYYGFPENDYSISEILDSCGSIISNISDYAESSYEYLIENKLYSLGDNENRSDGFATFSFYYPESNPFIYGKSNNNASDICSMIHESGHFTRNHTINSQIFDDFNLDLEETHSTGLEALSLEKFNDIWNRTDASVMYLYELLSLYSSVIEGCKYDDWQRTIYENPDMTLDEINDTFEKICEEYGDETTPGSKYTWVFVSHNFDAPMYYVSYAVSSAVALQIWQKSTEDYADAVEIWEFFINADCSDGYLELVKESGLSTFDDKSAMKAIFTDVYNYVSNNVSSMLW